MKILFRILFVFTLLPPLLCGLGFVLAALFDCTGTFHLETCRTPGTYGYVAPLLVMGWVSFFTVPIGAALLLVVVLLRAWARRRDAG